VTVIASSLSSVLPSHLTRICSNLVDNTTGGECKVSSSATSLDLIIPQAAFATSTSVNTYLNNTDLNTSLSGIGIASYLLNFVVEWHKDDGTIPAASKNLALTVTNSNIKKGMVIYVVGTSSKTALGTATVDGALTVNITLDPQLVIAATIPDAPTGVSATASTTAATVSWTAPASDGGSAITSYIVTSSGGQTCTTPDGATLSCVVTGLTNGTGYTFTVVAVNAVGNSLPSTASSSVTPNGVASAPGAPTSVTASAGDAQVVLSWIAPSFTGGVAITSYSVTSTPSGFTCSVSAPTTSCTITGLINATSYVFTVIATNASSLSSTGASSNSATPSATTPTLGSLTPNNGLIAGGTTITITGTNFAAGASVAIGGVAATSVVVVSSTSITAVTPAHAVGVVDVSVTVSGVSGSLINGFSYHSIPSAPTITSLSIIDTTTVSVAFSTGAANGSPITSYIVTATPSLSVSVSAGTTSPLQVTGAFIRGTSYSFTLISVNGDGQGASSSSSTSVTPYPFAGVVAVAPLPTFSLPTQTTSPTTAAKKPAVFEFYFDLGSYQLTSKGSTALRSLAAKISGLGHAISLTVTGFAQPMGGSNAADIALSQKRAAVVTKFLRENGVNSTITYLGAGRTAVNAATSRVVEVVVSYRV
jgi:outer membrane protein OmpA-like peptidoglycan-associated protein